MDPLAGTVVELVTCMLSPICKYWKHHRGLKANMNRLKQKMDALNSRKRDVQVRLDAEVVPRETAAKDEVQLWLQRVEIINAEVTAIEEKSNRVKCFSRAFLGKKVIKKRKEVEELYRDGEFPNCLVLSLRKQTGDILPTRVIRGETTSKRNMREIWTFLMDDHVSKIGVYGMGGIGKTTVMKHINNCLLETRENFYDTIWVTASKASSVVKLQDAIARKLELDISRYDDETTRAAKLFAELSKKGKYLLILDDLWQVFHLEDVGIPEPTPQNGCKLVLTTRLLNVCLGMSCKAIQMQCLSEEEALNLFLDTVGHDVLFVPNLEVIVNLVVKECACLPLAIVTVAGSLRGVVDYNDWKTALEDLRASTREIADEIFEKLKFSYDRLNDKSLQACLLYCALYPEDYEIGRDQLIEYLIAEDIIKGRNRQAELERGQAMLNKLVHACLLEDMTDRYGKAHVKMHDLIRDMAIRITSDDPRFLVEAGTGLKHVPDEENWKDDLAKVSLMYNNISDIPSSFESPNCPKLSTLLLNANHFLSSISSNFFLHMKELSVLDLSETSIENIPESISELVNLTALLLRKCDKLKYVPSLVKVTSLKKLDLYESGIKQVPHGMEKLAQLRYLDLESDNLEVMPDGILCKLSNLQFLSLSQAYGAKIRGEEMVYLRKLEVLYCVFYDIKSFNAYVGSLEMGGPNRYILQLGFTGGGSWFPIHKSGKVVYLTNCDIGEFVANHGQDRVRPLLLPQDVEVLALQSAHLHVSSLSELASIEHSTNLRSCCIKHCSGVEHLFSYSSSIVRLLQALEILVLEELRDLRWLIKRKIGGASSTLPPGTFSSLKELVICGCDNIKRLFNTSPLPNLQEIIVSECEELVEIISITSNADEEDDDQNDGGLDHHHAITVILPKLIKFHAFILPKLRSIPVVADSLQNVYVSNCPKLKRIPFLDREPCPPLRYLRIGEDVWESLEWYNPNAKDVIESMLR